MKMKAQGSLEYLIIVAAVLAIGAIVILFLTGVFGAGKSSADLTLCKDAAAKCGIERATSSNPPCEYCNKACSALPTKIMTCKEGKADEIF